MQPRYLTQGSVIWIFSSLADSELAHREVMIAFHGDGKFRGFTIRTIKSTNPDGIRPWLIRQCGDQMPCEHVVIAGLQKLPENFSTDCLVNDKVFVSPCPPIMIGTDVRHFGLYQAWLWSIPIKPSPANNKAPVELLRPNQPETRQSFLQ